MADRRTRAKTVLASGAVGALSLAGLVALPAPAGAANAVLNVSTLDQLRKAVSTANSRSGADTISLKRSIAFLSGRPGVNGDGPSRGDLDVTGTLRIEGNGYRINGNGADRVLDVTAAGTLILNDLALKGGDPASGTGGGAVRSAGDVTIVGSVVSGNRATGPNGSGGGVLLAGTAELSTSGTTFEGNKAARAGGAVEVVAGTTATVDSSVFRSNSVAAGPGNGGAVHITGNGSAGVTSSIFKHNTAAAEGGALWNSATGTLAVADSLFDRNSAAGAAADQGGGAVYTDGGDVTISDSVLRNNEATGAAGSGGAVLNNLGTLEVEGSQLSGNSAVRAGGAIEANAGTTTVTDSVLKDNEAGPTPGNGGAVHLTGAGTVTVAGSTVTGNTAVEGGGLWNSATGSLTVSDSTISGNTAAGAAADQGGGGLYNDGGALTVERSTINDNTATGTAGSGGGILNNLGALTVTGSSLSGNSAPRAGGAIETNIGTATLGNVNLIGNETGANPGRGGGLHVTGAAVVSYTDGRVTGNSAVQEGGGVWNSSTGTITATGLTARDNTAPVAPNVFTQPGGTFTLNGTAVPAGDNAIST